MLLRQPSQARVGLAGLARRGVSKGIQRVVGGFSGGFRGFSRGFRGPERVFGIRGDLEMLCFYTPGASRNRPEFTFYKFKRRNRSKEQVKNEQTLEQQALWDFLRDTSDIPTCLTGCKSSSRILSAAVFLRCERLLGHSRIVRERGGEGEV